MVRLIATNETGKYPQPRRIQNIMINLPSAPLTLVGSPDLCLLRGVSDACRWFGDRTKGTFAAVQESLVGPLPTSACTAACLQLTKADIAVTE
jgi:hypothetical protein